jgi:hypothetical protein
MSLWNGLKRGTKALLRGEEPVPYAAGGRKVRCPHCDSDRFVARRVLLNTYGMTLLNLDWANKEATTLTCDHCKMIQWFRDAPEQMATTSDKMIRDL